MLRGLYEFRPINDKTLGFRSHDLLLFLEPHARDKNWLRVADAHGHVGFVPINFIHVFKETTSEGLLAFLDEAIRRARRDHLPTLELLCAVRQNIVTSPYTTEEHVKQIDREVAQLREKAAEGTNYDDGHKRQVSPRDRGDHHQQQQILPPARSPGRPKQGDFISTPSGRMEQQHHVSSGGDIAFPPGSERSKKKEKSSRKPHPPPAEPYQDDVVQYSQLQVIHPHTIMPQQVGIINNSDLVAEYVRSTVCVGPHLGGSHDLTGHRAEGNNHDLFPNMGLLQEPPPYCDHDCGCGKPRRPPGRRFSQDDLIAPFNGSLLGAELVDIVRNATGLSHKLSQDATEAVLNFVIETFRRDEWDKVGLLLSHLEVTPRAVSQELGIIAVSPDAKTIRTIFNRLTQCKEDEQQRSWALHEDESMILDNLRKLNKILNDADPSISKFVMESDQYRSVNALVLYYQMETRWSIRTKLVGCFKAMCCIDEKAHSVLLNSILPMELAREMRENKDNADRMRMCADLLVILLSSGEPIPITHYDYLDSFFLDFVFETIENPPNQDEKITDCMVGCLFAYNLQFFGEKDNLIIATLERRHNANVFTQKVIYFLNRGVDPVDLLAHKRSIPNSVLKLTTDIFTSKRGADLFYTNDIKVLIDIVTRCVTDLSAGDETRTSYLKLIQVIIRNSNFIEHKHRHDDLVHCFSSIIQEEEEVSRRDQSIVKGIVTEFPTLFGLPC
ncbi:NCK-interacting protein with SH3 domain [Folsomia candida]|nr:NCK-interacting protein with SH3 domain [Folsomia candida]